MAQTNYTPIQLYNSATATATPSAGNLAFGELAINYRDGKLFYKDYAGVVQILATQAGSASALTGGSAGAIVYQSGVSTTTFLSLGVTNYLLRAGASAPEYVNPASVVVGTATNVASGATGSIPYQSAAGTTTFVAAGTAGQVLTISGGLPTWATSGTATLATNLAGGAAGRIAYQSALDTTAFVAAGTAGQLLIANGTSAPSWATPSTITVGTASTAIDLSGGVLGSIPYQTGAGATTFLALGTTNNVLTAGVAGPQYVAQSTLSVGAATTATNIAGGVTGAVPYQTSAGATTLLAPGSNGFVLTMASGVPSWAAAGTATTATNLAGGSAGTLPYQSAVGTTAFLSTGSAGQFLISTGASAPVWTSGSSLSVGSATNLAGGTTGSVPYQTSAGTTTLLAPGTNGYVLTLAAGVPTWAAGSSVSLSANNTWTGTQSFVGSSSVVAEKLTNAAEPANIIGTPTPSTVNLYAASGAVTYYTSNATTNWTINFAFSSGTSLNTALATGDAMTFVLLSKQGGTPYYPTSFTVDGSPVTPIWLGGSAPISGDASSTDVYTFTVIKTAAATFTILAAQSQYA